MPAVNLKHLHAELIERNAQWMANFYQQVKSQGTVSSGNLDNQHVGTLNQSVAGKLVGSKSSAMAGRWASANEVPLSTTFNKDLASSAAHAFHR